MDEFFEPADDLRSEQESEMYELFGPVIATVTVETTDLVMVERADALFELGRITATEGALIAAEGRWEDLCALVTRHAHGDWGDLNAEDRQANAEALVQGTRLLGAYVLHSTRLWIITEADRSVTTVLVPDE